MLTQPGRQEEVYGEKFRMNLSFNDPTLACTARMFLIDLTGNKTHIFDFGVKNACAEYHWASWGNRSVIAIKENIRFTYSSGKLSPPSADFGDGTPLLRRDPVDDAAQRNWPGRLLKPEPTNRGTFLD